MRLGGDDEANAVFAALSLPEHRWCPFGGLLLPRDWASACTVALGAYIHG